MKGPIYNHVRRIPGGFLFQDDKTNETNIKYYGNEKQYQEILDFAFENMKRWMKENPNQLDIDFMLENIWDDGLFKPSRRVK